MAIGDNNVPNSNPTATPASVLGGQPAPSVAPTPPEISAPATPAAPGMPINSTPAQPTNPKQTFGQSVKAGIRGPQYQADSSGQITKTNDGDTSGFKPKLGSVLGSMLMGALAGASSVRPGQRGASAFVSGIAADQAQREKDDALARQHAQQTFVNRQAAQKGQDEHDTAIVERARLSTDTIRMQQEMAQLAKMNPLLEEEARLGIAEHQASLGQNLYTQQLERDRNLGRPLGTFGSYADAMANPLLSRKVMVDHSAVALPHYNPDGTPGGVDVYDKGVMDQKISQDTTIYTPTGKVDSKGMPELAAHTISAGEMTNGQLIAQQQQAANAQVEALKTRADLAQKNSEAAKNNAEAGKANAETKNLRDVTPEGAEGKTGAEYLSALPAGTAATLKAVAEGREVRSPRSFQDKNGNATPFAQQLHLAYPNLDITKLQNYGNVRKDFEAGKTSIALNSGGTALQHLDELMALNTVTSRIPGTKAYNAFQNKLNTVASELVKFYGMPDTNESIGGIKQGMGAATNRDAAITEQIKSMADKFGSYQQTWENAQPNPDYSPPMPGISEEQKHILAAHLPQFVQSHPQFAPENTRGLTQTQTQTQTQQAQPQDPFFVK